MIPLNIIERTKEQIKKEQEDLANSIKYQIERKIMLGQIIREGKEAEKELNRLEENLKNNMCRYLYNNI